MRGKRISIHAPRTGSDGKRLPPCDVVQNFNPRSPHGERPALLRWRRWRRGFQPTLPGRGATGAFCLAFLLFGISTHAPRTGSDVRRAINHHASAQFQSTLPARGATQHQHGHGGEKPISIHAPRTGSDCIMRSEAAKAAKFQSTLPARGATNLLDVFLMELDNFNPRSPHGERRRKPHAASHHARFQSTLPARGATAVSAAHLQRHDISIHAPRTGSDGVTTTQEMLESISIHAPRTGSDAALLYALHTVIISIHAPRTGSDDFCFHWGRH